MSGNKRIDVYGAGESVESRSLELLAQLKSGEITVGDLMGPLAGNPDLTPEIKLPPGKKENFPSDGGGEFLPADCEHNKVLMDNCHPTDYVNPTPPQEGYDLVVIGAGVSGLLSVIVGAWLGKKCALIERHALGGDCLNTGCVPSKALIACARAIEQANNQSALKEFGISLNPELMSEGKDPYSIDFGFVMKRMREIRAKISHHDSVQRYSRDFCEHVFVGHAEFAQCDAPAGASYNGEVVVKGDDGTTRTLKYKKAMVATGASAAGLREVPHLTNSTFFNLTALPPSMLVIGCGPIGLELSQAMTRMGCNVTCFERAPQLLTREDPDAAKIVEASIRADGVNVMTSADVLSIEYEYEGEEEGEGEGEGLQLQYNAPWGLYTVTSKDFITGEVTKHTGQALLNCTGRAPNVTDCGLDNVGVEWDNLRGVQINDYFETTNPNIYSCGDCASPYKFTHAADFQARYAVRNMFLGNTEKQSDLLIPWCTYTEPEVAHVGKYESELDAKGVEYEVLMRNLADVDRCLCDGLKEGFVKILMQKGHSNILGATICGPNAGDMISELTVAMQWGVTVCEYPVPQLAGTIHPYPTAQEAVRQACLFGYMKYYKDPAGAPLMAIKALMKEKEEADAKLKL